MEVPEGRIQRDCFQWCLVTKAMDTIKHKCVSPEPQRAPFSYNVRMTKYWHSLPREDLNEVSVFGDFSKAIRTWFYAARARWPDDISHSVKTCCCPNELVFIKLELDSAVV